MRRPKIIVGVLRDALAPFDTSWLPLSENPDVHPKKKKKKNEPLSQEMHLKKLHFSSGLKMSGGL